VSNIKDRIDNTGHTGRIGEFFAMYALEKYGIECHHVDRSGVDLWCQSYNEDMFTLQIKAANTTLIRRGKRTYPRYSYNLRTTKIADFYMFIALDIQKVLVMPTRKLGRKEGLQIHPNKFTEETEKEGLDLLRNFRREDHPLGQ